MSLSSASASPARLAILTAALFLAAAPLGPAQTLSYSTPLGSITLFGSGPRTTFLQTSAHLGDASSAETLNYLDAPGSPATSRSEAIDGGASFQSIAQVGVNESQTTGLPFVSGRLEFASPTGDAGDGFAAITLYLLISVPDPVRIDLGDVRSAITTSGSAADRFSLSLFESDSSGSKIGPALLSFSGETFDAAGSYQSTSPFYLVQMNAAANATPAAADSLEFSYSLDLQPIAAIPEPGSAPLVLLAFLGLLIGRFRRLKGAA